MSRKYPLVTGEVYHIYSRSIANFKIFNINRDFRRMLMLFYYFKIENPPTKFSYFIRNKEAEGIGFFPAVDMLAEDQSKIVQLIAYCLMPTHIHLILKQKSEQGISMFIKNVLDGYTRYFNTCHKRKGPLWEGRFQNVLVKDDEQLLHLTRYFHLNSTTASLVEKPQDWKFSSYLEYLGDKNQRKFCDYDDLLQINPKQYKKFVEDRTNYQKELGKIKNLLID